MIVDDFSIDYVTKQILTYRLRSIDYFKEVTLHRLRNMDFITIETTSHVTVHLVLAINVKQGMVTK